MRSLVYSAWHRYDSIKRYLGAARAARLSMVDIDSCEACVYCQKPLALIETQMTEAAPKTARITQELAWQAGIPAFSVSCAPGEMEEIARFRVQRIALSIGPVEDMLPHEYAEFLWSLRDGHECPGTKRQAQDVP